eukprot:scaffold127175_cov52-Attheya_sp.AAC.3
MSMRLMLDARWRHFETVMIYRTHHAMGQALGSFFASDQRKRSDIFLTTKVFHRPDPSYSTEFTALDINMDRMSPHEVGIASMRLVLAVGPWYFHCNPRSSSRVIPLFHSMMGIASSWIWIWMGSFDAAWY